MQKTYNKPNLTCVQERHGVCRFNRLRCTKCVLFKTIEDRRKYLSQLNI